MTKQEYDLEIRIMLFSKWVGLYIRKKYFAIKL